MRTILYTETPFIIAKRVMRNDMRDSQVLIHLKINEMLISNIRFSNKTRKILPKRIRNIA